MVFGYDAHIAHFWAPPPEKRLDTIFKDLLQKLENDRHNIDAVSFMPGLVIIMSADLVTSMAGESEENRAQRE